MTLRAFRQLLIREYESRYGCPPSGTAWQREAWVAPFLRLLAGWERESV